MQRGRRQLTAQVVYQTRSVLVVLIARMRTRRRWRRDRHVHAVLYHKVLFLWYHIDGLTLRRRLSIVDRLLQRFMYKREILRSGR